MTNPRTVAAVKEIVAHIDALGCDISIRLCTNGTVLADVREFEIKEEHVLRSCCGYGDGADEAIYALWRNIVELEIGQYLLIRDGKSRRVVKWNGSAFKDWTAAFPLPSKAADLAEAAKQ